MHVNENLYQSNQYSCTGTENSTGTSWYLNQFLPHSPHRGGEPCSSSHSTTALSKLGMEHAAGACTTAKTTTTWEGQGRAFIAETWRWRRLPGGWPSKAQDNQKRWRVFCRMKIPIRNRIVMHRISVCVYRRRRLTQPYLISTILISQSVY